MEKRRQPGFRGIIYFSYFAEKLFMKYLLPSLLMLTAMITPLAGQVADTAKYVSLDPYYFHLEYLKDDSSLMLDVRMPFEFRGKRIRDAINIPSSVEMEAFSDTLSRNHSLFIYCYNGYRSRRAAELFYDKGFRKIYNLEGGIVAWKKDKMPTVRGRIKRKKAVREQ